MTSHLGTLYSVATPIGNLDDISLRAIETLRLVDTVVCEDTRQTAQLLQAHGIEGKQLISYHAQSHPRVEDSIIDRLRGGEQLALVTDRGTPGISDPGSRLIGRCVAAGITVVPIPGASALICALQAAGVPTNQFVFLGFLPHKKGRQTLYTEIVQATRTYVFYESPHRILKTLAALQDCDKQIVLGRELTKLHEEFLRGTAAELLNQLSSRPKVQGEFVVVVAPPGHQV